MLTPGEIAPKMLVTVFQWKKLNEAEAQPEEGMFMLFGPRKNRINTALCGEVLEVLAVQIPYVKVKTQNGQGIILDTRRLDLMEVSKEFAEAKISHD